MRNIIWNVLGNMPCLWAVGNVQLGVLPRKAGCCQHQAALRVYQVSKLASTVCSLFMLSFPCNSLRHGRSEVYRLAQSKVLTISQQRCRFAAPGGRRLPCKSWNKKLNDGRVQ